MSISSKQNVTGSLGYKLKKTQHLLRLKMDEALRSIDLTTPQYSVLAQLELKTGVSNAELARSSFITAQTMHAIVSNLESRGLIEKQSDTSHRRILRTKITKLGLKTVKAAHKIVTTVESKMLSTLNEKEALLLEKLLQECFNNLQ
jgi:DNA-binding MarR family transcriptional regulator